MPPVNVPSGPVPRLPTGPRAPSADYYNRRIQSSSTSYTQEVGIAERRGGYQQLANHGNPGIGFSHPSPSSSDLT
jgi:hypothetical protein